MHSRDKADNDDDDSESLAGKAIENALPALILTYHIDGEMLGRLIETMYFIIVLECHFLVLYM